MAYGIQVYSESGVLWFDTSTRLGRVLGTINGDPTSWSASGNFVVPNTYGSGELFAFAVDRKDGFEWKSRVPDVYVNGNTISWDYQGSWGEFREYGPFTIIYGVR